MTSQQLSAQRAKCAWVVLVALVVSSLAPIVTTPASASTSKTVVFSQSSSTLNATAKQQITSWKSSLNSASKITVTGYAPKLGNRNIQATLAMKRATAVVAQLQTVGIKATFTKKAVLLTVSIKKMQSANKAMIAVTSVKPVIKPSSSPSASTSASPSSSPSASSSASPSISPSASSSPSSSPEPGFKFSGAYIFDFVNCNFSDPQAAVRSLRGTSLTLTPSSPGATPMTFPLSIENTGNADNKLMNCKVSWQGLSVPSGTYRLKVDVACVLDSDDLSTVEACRPSNYQDQIGSISGTGPTGAGPQFSMSVEYPIDVVISQDTSISYEIFNMF